MTLSSPCTFVLPKYLVGKSLDSVGSMFHKSGNLNTCAPGHCDEKTRRTLGYGGLKALVLTTLVVCKRHDLGCDRRGSHDGKAPEPSEGAHAL